MVIDDVDPVVVEADPDEVSVVCIVDAVEAEADVEVVPEAEAEAVAVEHVSRIKRKNHNIGLTYRQSCQLQHKHS